MRERLEKIKEEALKQIEASDALEKLNDIRVAYLGKKGQLTSVLKSMKDVAPEDRPKVGQMVNDARALIEARLEETKELLAKRGSRPLEEDIRFLLEMYCQGSVYMTVKWILGGMEEEPEQIARKLVEAMPAKLEEVFEEMGLM